MVDETCTAKKRCNTYSCIRRRDEINGGDDDNVDSCVAHDLQDRVAAVSDMYKCVCQSSGMFEIRKRRRTQSWVDISMDFKMSSCVHSKTLQNQNIHLETVERK